MHKTIGVLDNVGSAWFVFDLLPLAPRSLQTWIIKVAERGGFEPPVRFYPYNGLANRRFRPLSHLSIQPIICKPASKTATGKSPWQT